MNNPPVSYTPRTDATPEAELSALASVYGFILACHAKKNAAGVTISNGDDAKKGSLKHEVRANTSLPR